MNGTTRGYAPSLRCGALMCGAAVLLTAPAAFAQSADATAPGQARLEEIVVTARKREESLQNVPVAVAVVSGEQLKNNLASDLAKIGELVPQVSLAQGGSGTGSVITIRGVSSSSSDAGIDQSVAIEIDGVPLSRGRIIYASMFDLGNVQVLQGPQALFFGKNSPAGVISIRSADPTSEFEGYATAGYEFRSDERYLEGAISGPLTDTLKARLAFRGSKIKGWLRNVAGPIQDIIDPTVIDPGATMGTRGPAGHDYAGRLTLAWTPTDDFDVKLKVLLNEQTRNAGNSTTEPFCLSPTTSPVLGRFPLPGADCAQDGVKSTGSVAPKFAGNLPYVNGGVPYLKMNIHFGSLVANKDFGALTLTSTTGYYHQIMKQMSVSDWSPYASIWAASKETYKLFTQELRASTDFAGPINFMAGVYYEHFDRPFLNGTDLNHVFNPVAGNYATVVMQSTSKGDYVSAFAQARWNILPNLELAGGARYSKDKKAISIVNLLNNPARPTLYAQGKVLKSKYSDGNISPEATLSWHPQPDQTLYVAYKTGYKGGGISNPFLMGNTTTAENLQFQPEKAEGFEGGYKATLFDRRLRFDLVGYSYKYSDLQVVSYNAALISFTLLNAATARIKGVQGSAEWLATDDLTVRGSFGYNDAKYTDYPNSPCYAGQTVATGCVNARFDLSGRSLVRAPKLTYSFGADYKPTLVAGWNTAFSANATHTASQQTAGDYAPGGFLKAYWLLNASVRVGPEDGPWELALIGRNLTNTYYRLYTIGWSGSGNPNQYVGAFNRPREVAVQATVRF